ncbi:related to WD40-repeat protein (notchless protein) [Serendipita indica DSM 11827]|uniref:Related to WD40-repeat protein (Notchless protein) n=1 Tax=Serendipita indica (strain DSM 11827) TaxID=1109443 RepID=G4TES3_SERID|nr:related to WD40-repeat protein (notchless protein) [Serendipita indica DSM 11827]
MLTRGSSSFAQHSTRKRGRAYSIAAVGLEFGSNVAEASDILAPLKAACRATKTILDVIQAIDDNKEKWTELVQRLEEHKAHIKDQIDQFEKYPPAARVLDKSLSQSLNHYKEILEDFKNKIEHHRHKRNRKSGIFSGITRSKLDADAILQFYRDIEDRHKRFMVWAPLFILSTSQAIGGIDCVHRTPFDASTILQLPMVAFVASSVHTKCLEGTRQAVLRMIHDWAEDMGGKPIFWLCDIAGSGKSTVAMSVVASWATEGTLGGQFFFSMTCNDATTTEKFCSTIARELAQHMPELRPYIADALKQKSAILRSSFGDQFRALITNPLRHRDERVILVIDAIDECSSGAHTKELLDTLAKAVQESKNLKIFITSRPDPVIEGVLGPLSIKQTLEDRLHDVKHSDNIRDIATYVNKSLHGVLSQDQRQKLVDKANGLFIWASTACQMLRDKSSFDTPQVIYQRLISADHAGDIDDVYNLVFERVHPRNHAKMWKMLAILLAAYEPLRTDELDELFGVHGSSAKMLVRNIASILVEDTATKTIQFRHPTMVEYLQRCSTTQTEHRDRVSLHISDAHGQLAAWCFRSLRSPAHGLKFNICKIASSFDLNRQIPDLKTRVSKFIQARLRYASSHWSFHLAQTDGIWRKNLENDLRHTISSPNVLYWIEILSITERVPRAIAGLRAVTRQKGFDEETMNRIIDANRFMMAFSAPIQDSAPHIYVSALAFAPMKSPLRLDASKEHRNILKVTQGLEEKYHDLPQALRGHTSSVRGVAFSPDGSRIISGSSDSTIRVWDAETGQTLGEPLRGHNKSSVNAVAFSPDGSRFVSGSWDNTLRLWDAETAKPLGEPLEGHEDSVNAVAFSPDASRIASASWDKAIRLWDANTGQPLGEPLRGHKGWVNAVAFSEDGSRIVSGSSDQTIQLWDVETGQPLGLPLTGHNSPVNTVVFSPDGSRIVSGALDGTIRLWDGKDVQPLGELLRGHTSSVNAIAFSPDGSTFITGSWDRTIRLWNAATGQPVGEPLTGHTHWVNALAFSPDGSRIISGSSDKTIRIWDAKTGLPLGEPHPGHASAVNAVSFSPDGLVIASSSSDNTVRLWAADTGQPLTEPLRGHTEEPRLIG